jgi:hypothetical protein
MSKNSTESRFSQEETERRMEAALRGAKLAGPMQLETFSPKQRKKRKTAKRAKRAASASTE